MSEEAKTPFNDDDDILDVIENQNPKDPFLALSHYQYKADPLPRAQRSANQAPKSVPLV